MDKIKTERRDRAKNPRQGGGSGKRTVTKGQQNGVLGVVQNVPQIGLFFLAY